MYSRIDDKPMHAGFMKINRVTEVANLETNIIILWPVLFRAAIVTVVTVVTVPSTAVAVVTVPSTAVAIVVKSKLLISVYF